MSSGDCPKCIACFLLVYSISLTAVADYLEVHRSAKLKVAPESGGAVLQRLAPGVLLELLDDGDDDDGDQINGYYRALYPATGQTGWIYRTRVRRHRGEIPPADDALTANPLADPTYALTLEERRYAAHHLSIGKPQAVYERVRQGYVVAYDGRLKIPVWVQYVLRREELDGSAERKDNFRADTSIPLGFRSELTDYEGSGFDRGHMAPAGAMKRSVDVMSESFFLSNMAPQIGIGFNRHIWANLEKAVRGWVEQRGALTIIMGPVFKTSDDGQIEYHVIGANHVAVPTHFFKVIVDSKDPDRVETLAFLLPNEKLTSRHYREFLSSIDEIERLCGLDLLTALPKTIQDAVEAHAAPAVW